MDDQSSLISQTNSQFGLWHKWFWIGIVMSLIFSLPGLIYGVALALEKEYRKEGIIIVAFAVVWYFILSAFFAWMLAHGKPYFQLFPYQSI